MGTASFSLNCLPAAHSPLACALTLGLILQYTVPLAPGKGKPLCSQDDQEMSEANTIFISTE